MVTEQTVIVDTGPLIAFLDSAEPWHSWVDAQFRILPTPLITCEPVITEAFHLLRRVPEGARQLFQMISRGAVRIDYALMPEVDDLERLMRKYRDLPMSLADACLVRMSERFPMGPVFTLDRHFKVYRRNGRQAIPTLMPEE